MGLIKEWLDECEETLLRGGSLSLQIQHELIDRAREAEELEKCLQEAVVDPDIAKTRKWTVRAVKLLPERK